MWLVKETTTIFEKLPILSTKILLDADDIQYDFFLEKVKK